MIILTGSPSKYGWNTDVHTKNDKPNGNKLSAWNYETNKAVLLEFNGPYMHGWLGTFMSVNSHLEHYDYKTKPSALLNNKDNSNSSNNNIRFDVII